MGYYGNRELLRNARALRNNMTRAEIILWSRLRSKQVDGHKFRRQQPIFEYVVDFYCHELKLIIEVDGEVHSLKENENYDKKRDRVFEINGYHLLHLSNPEVEMNIDVSINRIKKFIKTISTPPGRTKGGLPHE